MSGAADNSTNPCILIVENDVLVRTTVAAYLRECGYRVVEAANGGEGRQLLGADITIDILFTVVELPDEQDGFALASWARREKPGLKVILASGVKRAAAEAGDLCEHGPMLAKPYDHASLESHIRRLLAKSPPERK